MRNGRTIAALLIVSSLFTRCAATRDRHADVLFAAGDFAGAAQAYEAILANPIAGSDDHLLFRAAVAHAEASPPARNEERSRALLEMLLAQFPNSEYRSAAAWILRMHDEAAAHLTTLDEERDSRTELDARIEALEQERDALTDRIANAEKESVDRAALIAALRREVDRLQTTNRTQSERIRSLELEISLLKAIDLDEVPE